MAPIGLLSALLAACAFLCAGAIGVNYGRLGDLPEPTKVVQLIKSLSVGVDGAKIFDASSDVLNAFSNSGLKLIVAVRNDQISSFASGSAASDWVKQTIVPVYPATMVDIVVVGNEVLSHPELPSKDLVPAMKNVRSALDANGLQNIKVSTPLATDVLGVSYPPSQGAFKGDSVIQELVDFLASTNSVFMINVYPYFSWQGNRNDISLEYALFGSNNVVVQDGNNGYTNLFDAIFDAVVAAVEKSGHADLGLVVGESGWPSAGADGATVDNAQKYNSRLISKMKSNQGTPRRPGSSIPTYIFALFNENKKTGDEIERHFGLLNPDGSPVYSLD